LGGVYTVSYRPRYDPAVNEPAFARMWEFGGRWYARLDAPAFIEVTGITRERCLEELRKVTGDDVTLSVEVTPALAGVAECAEIMGWDKRRVITYIDRGRFPEPIQSLASGRVWLRADVERFAAEWKAGQSRRSRRR
jgi:hypothetical protein